MSASLYIHQLSLAPALTLPHCCVGCYAEADQDLPEACILEPCARHQRGGDGKHRRPTAVGDPAPDDLPCNVFGVEALAERGRYLLDYGLDVVERFTPIDTVGAIQLNADLAALDRSLGVSAHHQDVIGLREIVRRIDEVLALAELVLLDTEEYAS